MSLAVDRVLFWRVCSNADTVDKPFEMNNNSELSSAEIARFEKARARLEVSISRLEYALGIAELAAAEDDKGSLREQRDVLRLELSAQLERFTELQEEYDQLLAVTSTVSQRLDTAIGSIRDVLDALDVSGRGNSERAQLSASV